MKQFLLGIQNLFWILLEFMLFLCLLLVATIVCSTLVDYWKEIR